MKMSKKDRNLLVLLLVIVVLAGYYFFVLKPSEEKMALLEQDLVAKEAAKMEVDIKLATEKGIDERIIALENEIKKEADTYYSALTQEEMLMIVTNFGEGLELEITALNFVDVLGDEGTQVQYTADVTFNSNYTALLDYFRNVKKNDKKVVIRDLSVQNMPEGGISGRYKLEFNAFPGVSTFTKPAKTYLGYALNERQTAEGPFNPYEGHVITVPTEDLTFPEFPTEEETIDYETYRPKTQIYGFEDGSNFFVGNLPEIKGNVKRSQTKVAGGYSAEIEFDFVQGRPYSEANVVFDGDGILLTRQAEYLGLWAYAYEASTHKIGAVIVDSAGKAFKIELAPAVDWTQWKELEVILPLEITYPCVIQRIYVEGIGYEQKLTGRYLFDQFQVSYPLE